MKSWIIAKREISERLKSRSFLLLALFGPIIILGLLYLVITLQGAETQKWNVLVADPIELADNKMMSANDPNMKFSFINKYVGHEDFADGKKYQEYDALVEINEKILSNRVVFVFYRNKPSFQLQRNVQYIVEKRIEELMVKKYTDLSLKEFREIKQPLTFGFRNVYDPYDQTSDIRGWVGFAFGGLILFFIGLFGMTLLRSVSNEKSNRVIEIILSSVKPGVVMRGKLLGIGITALFLFLIWVLLIGGGLYVLREFIFTDLYDASKMIIETSSDSSNRFLTIQEQLYKGKEFNAVVDLIFERINFSVMIGFFLVFFVLTYVFYGSIFLSIGAAQGSEGDGQQFILPILAVLLLSVYCAYYALSNPEGDAIGWMQYFPFTAGPVWLVKLSQGIVTGAIAELFVAILLLILTSIIFLFLAGRIYKNGVLNHGHRLSVKQLIQWIRK